VSIQRSLTETEATLPVVANFPVCSVLVSQAEPHAVNLHVRAHCRAVAKMVVPVTPSGLPSRDRCVLRHKPACPLDVAFVAYLEYGLKTALSVRQEEAISIQACR
jgi:hypothetical protein